MILNTHWANYLNFLIVPDFCIIVHILEPLKVYQIMCWRILQTWQLFLIKFSVKINIAWGHDEMAINLQITVQPLEFLNSGGKLLKFSIFSFKNSTRFQNKNYYWYSLPPRVSNFCFNYSSSFQEKKRYLWCNFSIKQSLPLLTLFLTEIFRPLHITNFRVITYAIL
jgi:hypothetical protein